MCFEEWFQLEAGMLVAAVLSRPRGQPPNYSFQVRQRSFDSHSPKNRCFPLISISGAHS